jgi:hypothetical protein
MLHPITHRLAFAFLYRKQLMELVPAGLLCTYSCPFTRIHHLQDDERVD